MCPLFLFYFDCPRLLGLLMCLLRFHLFKRKLLKLLPKLIKHLGVLVSFANYVLQANHLEEQLYYLACLIVWSSLASRIMAPMRFLKRPFLLD